MSLRSKTNTRISRGQRGRFLFVRGCVILIFALVATRLVYVQAIMREDLSRRADRQFQTGSARQTVRHNIVDRAGRILAETVQIQSCFIDPALVRDQKRTAAALAGVMGVDRARLQDRLSRATGRFMWVRRDVPAETVRAVQALKLPGVGFQREWRRHYPEGPIASHVLGFVGVEGRGLSGVELQYDAVLSGAGDTSGRAGDVHLTIDAWLQGIAERELAWGVEKAQAKGGTVIIQEPRSGEILALASWPPLSLDTARPPAARELRIPAVIDVFEPGSTFKIVTLAAAMEEAVAHPGEVFDGENGVWRVSGIRIRDHDGVQKMTFEEIMTRSSNIGCGKLADRLGDERLYQYARRFGFGVFPGSGLSPEARGVLRRPTAWSGVSRYAVSFGQEVGVTALQLAGAYSAVANGGVLMEPRLIKAVQGRRGERVWESRAAEVRRVMSRETAAQLNALLVSTVRDGTARNAQPAWVGPVRVAGKTGTAQKFDNALGRYRNDNPLVSFCGYFPASAPRFTVLVLLDEADSQSWGGTVAAPLFRRIAEQIVSNPMI